jgi:hypothetical protein
MILKKCADRAFLNLRIIVENWIFLLYKIQVLIFHIYYMFLIFMIFNVFLMFRNFYHPANVDNKVSS